MAQKDSILDSSELKEVIGVCHYPNHYHTPFCTTHTTHTTPSDELWFHSLSRMNQDHGYKCASLSFLVLPFVQVSANR